MAQRLSNEFKESRSDCAEQGWNPGFPTEQAGKSFGERTGREVRSCYEGNRMAGTEVSERFILRTSGRDNAFLAPTARAGGAVRDLNDGKGLRKLSYMMLVHFDPLPFDDGFGCWYFVGGRWWYEEGVWDGSRGSGREGKDAPKYPHCEDQLRSSLRDLHAEGQTLDVDGVAAAIQRVNQSQPDDCMQSTPRVAFWGLFPRGESRSGCPVEAPTGALQDGGLVVHWHPGYSDSFGGAVCWVMAPDGEWSAYGPSNGGPPGTVITFTGPAPAAASPAADRTVSYDLPPLERWFDPDKSIPFYQDAGPGDHTADELKGSHPYSDRFYEEGDPVALLNFVEGTMQFAIARRLAEGAVEAQPAQGDLGRTMEILFEENLAWEIRDEALPVVNLWITYKVSGDNPRK